MYNPARLLILLCTLSALTGVAQKNDFNIGVEGGPGFGILLTGASSPYKMYSVTELTGTGALTFKYNFTRVVSVKTNLAYDRKGEIQIAPGNQALFYTPQGGITYISRSKFDYLDVPVMLRGDFGKKKVKFFINAGPYVALLLQATDFNYNVTNNFHRFDGGIASGLGIELPVYKNISFSAELRNNAGLYNIYKIPAQLNTGTGGNPYYTRTNTSNVIIGFSYKIPDGKRAQKLKGA